MPSPSAPRRPHRLEKHGDVRVDDYYWLRDREDPEVRAYLDAENAWVRGELAHTEALQEELFEEIKGRIKQTDMSVPYREGAYLYHRRYEDGREYPIYCRRALGAAGEQGDEEVLLDVNAVAEGHRLLRGGLVRGESGRAAACVRCRHGRSAPVRHSVSGTWTRVASCPTSSRT